MWCVKLSDSQRDGLRALIKEGEKQGEVLSGALEACPRRPCRGTG
jgi:hypothetical protein